jgi:hypothetical protein
MWLLWLLITATASPVHAAQQQLLAVSIKGVTTAVLARSKWSVSNTANTDSVQTTVAPNSGWAKVR